MSTEMRIVPFMPHKISVQPFPSILLLDDTAIGHDPDDASDAGNLGQLEERGQSRQF